MGTQSVIAPDDYCRAIEAYLCRKNDGHLIRIVGPAFEQVSRWALEGIPLNVACSGVDRYFERYYKKKPRRRPVRIEFCDADVRDAFDDWRRAVGVAAAPAHADEENSRRRRSSLAAHIERVLTRLAALRGSTQASVVISDTLDTLVRRLDRLLADASRARGGARAAISLELATLDRQMIDAALAALSPGEREHLDAEAARELDPFRSRMLQESFAKAQTAAFERLVRARFSLPTLGYE